APHDPPVLERTAYNYRAVARLRDGVTVDAANARLADIAAQLTTAYPASNTNKSFSARPLREQMVAPVRTTLLVLLGAVGLVLVMACANVANLMLARASARSREIALRAALGAGHWHIARQLLAESGLVAIAAGTLGVVMATVGTRALLLRGSQS